MKASKRQTLPLTASLRNVVNACTTFGGKL